MEHFGQGFVVASTSARVASGLSRSERWNAPHVVPAAACFLHDTRQAAQKTKPHPGIGQRTRVAPGSASKTVLHARQLQRHSSGIAASTLADWTKVSKRTSSAGVSTMGSSSSSSSPRPSFRLCLCVFSYCRTSRPERRGRCLAAFSKCPEQLASKHLAPVGRMFPCREPRAALR